MNPLTAHYKDWAVGSLKGYQARCFSAFPRIGFSSLGTSDFVWVIQFVRYIYIYISISISIDIYLYL